jgi:hypothetical protein
VAALDVPAVVHIIYESDDDATLLCLMERHHTLDKVTHFTLNVGAATEQILHALLSRLPALSSLDVLASDLRILDAFFVGDKFSSTMVCPNLTHLMLEEESPTDVRHFMEQRCVHGSAKPLQQVIFRPDLDTNDPDFQWLKERVELFVDIPFKAPKWISNGKFYAEND